MRRLNLPEPTAMVIDWNVIEYISNHVQDHKRQQYLKVMANIAPVGRTLKRRGKADSVHCPLCNMEESNIHIWMCPHLSLKEIRGQGLDKLFTVLQTGPRPFQTFLMTQLYTVCGNNASVGHEEHTNGVWRQALEKQQNFSVWASVWGFYHVSVTQLLGEFFANTRIDATRWISKSVLHIWTIYDEMWNFRNTVRHETGQETDANAHSIADREIMELRNKAPAMQFLMVPERSENFYPNSRFLEK